ncbi:hypothetical protein F511_04632, partial [Dorcoceras hygrometricum]
LLWKNQITPILACHNLLGYINGSKPAPSPTTQNTADVSVPNRAYDAWHTQDQRLLSLLLCSLTEESMAEVIGCTTSRAVWLALEAAFIHRFKSRELRLKDDLQLMKKVNRTVFEYGRQFKSLCDQPAAVGRLIDETDKSHWFLCGLVSSFSSFCSDGTHPTPNFSGSPLQGREFLPVSRLFRHLRSFISGVLWSALNFRPRTTPIWSDLFLSWSWEWWWQPFSTFSRARSWKQPSSA